MLLIWIERYKPCDFTKRWLQYDGSDKLKTKEQSARRHRCCNPVRPVNVCCSSVSQQMLHLYHRGCFVPFTVCREKSFKGDKETLANVQVHPFYFLFFISRIGLNALVLKKHVCLLACAAAPYSPSV